MLTETLSGKCPCCNYDKMIQRYGSIGYYQLDGCPKCGFGYGSNGHDEDSGVGPTAWLDFGIHIVAIVKASEEVPQPKIIDDIIKQQGSISSEHPEYKKHQEEFDKAYYKFHKILSSLDNDAQRLEIFKWAEKSKRSDDVESTIFEFTEEDISNYKSTNPQIFN